MNTPLSITGNPAAPDSDFLGLGAHIRACHRALDPTFALRCAAEWLHSVLGPRFFTTVFAVTAVVTVVAGCA